MCGPHVNGSLSELELAKVILRTWPREDGNLHLGLLNQYFQDMQRNVELVSCHWFPLFILFLASSPPRDCSFCDWSMGNTKQSKDKPNGRAKMRLALFQTEFRHWFADDRVTIGKRLCVLEVVVINDAQYKKAYWLLRGYSLRYRFISRLLVILFFGCPARHPVYSFSICSQPCH